jgi:hypothetical protein
MKRNVLSIPAFGLRMDDLGEALYSMLVDAVLMEPKDSRFTSSEYRGFPIVKSNKDNTLLGYITRADLSYSIGKRLAVSMPSLAK